MIHTSIAGLIGNTPLLKLSKIGAQNGNELYAKCEFQNPAGGIKDRIALYSLKKLKESGVISDKTSIICATAGNTGLALALAGVELNLKVILVVAEKFSPEKQALMKALGAQIIHTPKNQGIDGSIERAKALATQTPNAYYFDQFTNEFNPKAH